ncbi:MAG: dihydrodipicolinate reductase [Chloroflexi bacterium]|nr:dihydrodipicolinate reductase [Chloroflexota bacterium]
MASKKIRVIAFGLGPIGSGIARVVAAREGFTIVGAVDIDPAKAGKDVGSVIGFDHPMGVPVSGDAAHVLKKKADVVIHSTGSVLTQVEPQLAAIIRARHNIVSTCEELSQPWTHGPVAKRIDALAKKFGVTVLGTGINPGFMMDTLPILLTGVCQQVSCVRVRRVVDASKRRLPLQKKIGTGLTVDEFKAKAAKKEIRHVGLTESVALVARTLNWKLDKIEETIEPVVASTSVKTEYFEVAPGFVTGVRQFGYGIQNGRRVIELDLKMCVDAGESVDEVWLEGKPEIHSVIHGVHGDLSTAAVAANSIRRVVAAPPGLATMADIPIISVA